MRKNKYQDVIDVLAYQRKELTELATPESKTRTTSATQNPKDVTFQSILQTAHNNGHKNSDIYTVATLQEVERANELLQSLYKDYSKQYQLDPFDYAMCGTIGTVAALMDLFLVTSVNGTSVTPGAMKSGVEKLLSKALSGKRISTLENTFKVTYDISKNTSAISQEVLGLCPLYHRIMSLGHDPILGFLFGVKDLMYGTITTIDGAGRLVIQSVSGAKSKKLLESIVFVFGHFLSDVVTQSKTGKILSVPAPLTPLLQLVDVGKVSYNGKTLTVSELTRKMFYDGYNFNHFVGMSVPVFLVEVLTRICFFTKENLYLKKAVRAKKNPKLNTMLLIASSILTAENVGKLVITQNPMSINYVAWIQTAEYGIKTLKWFAYDKAIGEIDYAQKTIDNRWRLLANASTTTKPYHVK